MIKSWMDHSAHNWPIFSHFWQFFFGTVTLTSLKSFRKHTLVEAEKQEMKLIYFRVVRPVDPDNLLRQSLFKFLQLNCKFAMCQSLKIIRNRYVILFRSLTLIVFNQALYIFFWFVCVVPLVWKSDCSITIQCMIMWLLSFIQTAIYV